MYYTYKYLVVRRAEHFTHNSISLDSSLYLDKTKGINMNNYLDKLHRTLVEILDYVVSVCNENKLNYFLVYGTALGAYRHKGFIPWDDDLDIGMPREDYQTFLRIMEKKKNENFSIQNEDSEKNWYLQFSKVRKKGTLFIESIAEDMYENNGIYIDIFPLDYVKDANNQSYNRHRILINYVKHGLKFNACKKLYRSQKSIPAYLADYLFSLPVGMLPRRKMLNWLNRQCIGDCTKKEARYIAQYDDKYAVQVMAYDVYFPARQIEFEGKLYSVPNKIEDYLSIAYGSTYMELPPIEQRKTHQPVKLEF